MNRDELATSMATKAEQYADVRRRMDINGQVAPAELTEDQRQRHALQGGLDLALENGDPEAAGVFAEAIARITAKEAH